MALRLKNSRRSSRLLPNGSATLVAVLLFFLLVLVVMLARTRVVSPEPLLSVQPSVPQPITITFVGDVMLDRGVRTSVVKNLGGDYGALFANTGYLKDADITFANLEGPVATGGYNVGSRFSFRMDPAALVALQSAGFDIVSFANNHVGDYTLAAFTETLQHLKENNIFYTGAGNNYEEATAPAIINVRGIKVGFLGATDVGPEWIAATNDRAGLPAQAGILLASDPHLAQIVSDAKKEVDVLIVAFHWGIEYSPANTRQEKLAHEVIDAGADIVYGAHPHVMQRFEYYKEKPIFYSLGNFIFDQYFSPHTLQGMVATVSIDPETKAITSSVMVSPQDQNFVPQTLIPFDESMLVTKTFTP